MKVSITYEFDSIEEAAASLATEEVVPTPEKPAKAAKKPAKTTKKKPTSEPEVEDTAGEIDLDGLRAVFQELVKGGKRPEALELLKKYKIAKIHEVDPDDMEAMYEDAVELRDAEEDPLA